MRQEPTTLLVGLAGYLNLAHDEKIYLVNVMFYLGVEFLTLVETFRHQNTKLSIIENLVQVDELLILDTLFELPDDVLFVGVVLAEVVQQAKG